LRIGIVGTRGIPARYGGFETCAEELAKGLTAKGHRVYVACRKYLYPEFFAPASSRNYKWLPFPLGKRSGEGVFQFFPPSLPGKTTDTFSHTFFGVFYLLFFRPVDAFLVFNVANSPIVLLLRILGKKVALNTDGLEWKRRKWGPFARAYFRACELIACLSGAVLISDSGAIRDYYRKKYGKKTVFIPYGARVKDKIFRSAQNDTLKEYGLEEEGYILVVGRLEPENNADLIIRAFQKVKTDKLLVIVGGTNWKSSYRRRLGKTDDRRVRFPGAVYRPGHLDQLLESCCFYVHGHEVGGTNPALLQAMGSGCCVLALDTVFNAETVGGTGLLFAGDVKALAGKMQYLLANPEVVRYYRKAALERIKEFYRWEKVTADYEKILR
jgi:glycosyltransferase involved in cell wall biosynthesis